MDLVGDELIIRSVSIPEVDIPDLPDRPGLSSTSELGVQLCPISCS